MNEQIKQLADKAWRNSPHWTPGYIHIETFAELIVRECMDVAYDHTPNSEECEYKRLIHNKIKQHFGVEE